MLHLGQIDVLKEIGCIDNELVVQIKGRVACEMNSGEELICTECLFENQLDDLEPEEAVALMSAFVFQQRNASEPSLTPRLLQAKERYLFFPLHAHLYRWVGKRSKWGEVLRCVKLVMIDHLTRQQFCVHLFFINY